MNEKQPARDDYAELARRLGFDETARTEGPVRAAICQRRAEHQDRQRRLGSSSGESTS